MTIEEYDYGFLFSKSAWIQEGPLLMIKPVIRFIGGRRPSVVVVETEIQKAIKTIQKSIQFGTPIRIGEFIPSSTGVLRLIDIEHECDGEYCITYYFQEQDELNHERP